MALPQCLDNHDQVLRRDTRGKMNPEGAVFHHQSATGSHIPSRLRRLQVPACFNEILSLLRFTRPGAEGLAA
jgi:hypothetical protein